MRTQCERHRDLDGALIAMGQFPHESVGLGPQAHLLQRLCDARVDVFPFAAPYPRAQPITGGNLSADAHVLKHTELGKDLGDLKSAGHAEADALVGRHPGDVPALEQDAAGARREVAADQIEERGLAGAVRTYDGVQFALGHGEGYVLHGNQVAEPLADASDL